MGAEFGQEQRSEARRDIGAWGRYRSGRGVARDVKIFDVNANGCRFYDKFTTLRPGARVTLKIGNIGPMMTHIRWTERFVVGCEFDAPLNGAVLDHITKYFDERSAEEKAMREAEKVTRQSLQS